MLAPSLPLYSESQPACLLCLSQQHHPLTQRIYSKFLVFVFTFLETFSGMLLASIGLVIFDFLIHLKKKMFLTLVAFALLLLLLFYGWGALLFVCSDNNHSFRGDSEQPVYYSSLTI